MMLQAIFLASVSLWCFTTAILSCHREYDNELHWVLDNEEGKSYCRSVLGIGTKTSTSTIQTTPTTQTVTDTVTATGTGCASLLVSVATVQSTVNAAVTFTTNPTTVKTNWLPRDTQTLKCASQAYTHSYVVAAATNTTSPSSHVPAITAFPEAAPQQRLDLKKREDPYTITQATQQATTIFPDVPSSAVSFICSCASLTSPTVTSTTVTTTGPIPHTTILQTTTVDPAPVISSITVVELNTALETVTETASLVTLTVDSKPPAYTDISTNGVKYYRYKLNYNFNPGTLDPSSVQNNLNYFIETTISWNFFEDFILVCPNPGTCVSEIVVVQGFFLAAAGGGTYKFWSTDTVSEQLMLYHGDIAYGKTTKWSRSNADYNIIGKRSGKTGAQAGSVNIELAENEVMPFTLVWATGVWGGHVNFGFTGPRPSPNSTQNFIILPCENPFKP